MGNSTPRELRAILRSHNATVLIASVLSLLAAIAVWVLIYHLGLGASLAGRTFVQGDQAVAPATYRLWFSAALLLTLTGTFAWRFFHPPGQLRDRPIIGWHVIPEILLLPASLILAVTDNLAAYRKVKPERLGAAWELLERMLDRGKLLRRNLPQLGINPRLLEEALMDLQYAGLIDLHEGREEWFYRIRGTEEDRVRSWRTNLAASR